MGEERGRGITAFSLFLQLIPLLVLFGVWCLIYLLDLQFHFDQSKVRSEIRLREGRLKPIDVLCKHLDGSDDLDIELSEPYMVFKVLTKIMLNCKTISCLVMNLFHLVYTFSGPVQFNNIFSLWDRVLGQ